VPSVAEDEGLPARGISLIVMERALLETLKG